jgi:hypothetical protein
MFLLAQGSLMLIGLVLTVSCAPPEVELPFETIEQDIAPWYGGAVPTYESRQPGLKIITDIRAADQLTGITSEARARLKTLNYDSHFALVIFLGEQGTGHTGIRIERLVRRGDRVFIAALVGERIGTDEVTSPYHLVKIEKRGQWGKNIDFEAVSNKTTIVTTTHYIP